LLPNIWTWSVQGPKAGGVGFFSLQAEGSLIETAIPKVTKALEVRLNGLHDFPLKEKTGLLQQH
jgi:hypothetical protein